MITRVLSLTPQTSQSLDYNERKVRELLAEPIVVRNIPGIDAYSIYRAMHRLESNPSISRKTSKCGFHLAVNPGVDDKCTEPEVIEYIDTLMGELGFAEQPYVVYRHHDIERQHYHIVSCRIKPNGRVVRDCFVEYSILSIQKKYAERFHFTPGLPVDQRRVRRVVLNTRSVNNIPYLDRTDNNKMQRLDELLSYIMEFNFVDIQQFIALMHMVGLEPVMHEREDEYYNIMFRNSDYDSSSRYVNTGFFLVANNRNAQTYKDILNTISANKNERVELWDYKVRLEQIIQFCMGKAYDGEDFRQILEDIGVRMELRSSAKEISRPRYFDSRITPGRDVIFVFGSNPEGRHGAGAAKIACEQFGAVYGKGEGLQGNAYALPTKDLRVRQNNGMRSISGPEIIKSIQQMYDCARKNPDKQFMVAYTNKPNETTLNGYTGAEMIRFFVSAGQIPSNVVFSSVWREEMERQLNEVGQAAREDIVFIDTRSHYVATVMMTGERLMDQQLDVDTERLEAVLSSPETGRRYKLTKEDRQSLSETIRKHITPDEQVEGLKQSRHP